MHIPFVKMHGAGNDFIMLDAIKDQMPQDLKAFSRQICDRHFGVGADQVLIAYASDSCDFRMDIYNADGGHVEMCGNGIRAFAQYLKLQGHTQKNEITIETLGGKIVPLIIPNHPKTTESITWVKVDMGEPILEASQIPTTEKGQIVLQDLDLGEAGVYQITAVSMGNPHCVIYVDDVESFPVHKVGPLVENHSLFPKRVNVEFVQVKSKSHVVQRTWERGSGETLACGTGASAVCVAGVLTGKSDRNVTISLKGGDLDLTWDESTNHVFKTGPAEVVFEGQYFY